MNKIALLMLIVFTNSAVSSVYTWDGDSGTSDWYNRLNWNHDQIPAGVFGDVVEIGNATVNINHDTGLFTKIQIADQGDAVVNIKPGVILTAGWLLSGYSANRIAVVNIQGTVNLDSGRLYMGNSGKAHYNLDNGAIYGINTSIWIGDKGWSYGQLNLKNNSFAYFQGNSVYPAIAVRNFGFSAQFNLDTTSILLFEGDQSSTVNANIDKFVCSSADALIDYHYDPADDLTTVIAVAEPSAMLPIVTLILIYCHRLRLSGKRNSLRY